MKIPHPIPYQGSKRNLASQILRFFPIPFILSYDGRTGDKVFGKPLPEELNLVKIELDAGRSSTATLHNRKQNTFESLYISTYLNKKISIQDILNPKQIKTPTLFD